jgi:hypothetical protein
MNTRRTLPRLIHRPNPHKFHDWNTTVFAPDCHITFWTPGYELAFAGEGGGVDYQGLSYFCFWSVGRGKERKVGRFDQSVDHECAAGFALAPGAVAAVNEERGCGEAVLDCAAGAAACQNGFLVARWFRNFGCHIRWNWLYCCSEKFLAFGGDGGNGGLLLEKRDHLLSYNIRGKERGDITQSFAICGLYLENVKKYESVQVKAKAWSAEGRFPDIIKGASRLLEMCLARNGERGHKLRGYRAFRPCGLKTAMAVSQAP